MSQTFSAKTKDELHSMDIPELVEYVASLTSQVEHKDDEHKQAMDEKEKDAKKAQDEKDDKEEEAKKAKKAQDEEEKKHEGLRAALLKAMDEPDDKKREAMIKTAMDEDEKHESKKGKTAMGDDDEEKKALKAEITYLSASIKQPKIDYLTKVYKASNTPDKELGAYVAEWIKKSPQQLDAEIKKTAHLAEVVSYQAEEKPNPFGFNGAPNPISGPAYEANNSDFKKIDKMTPDQAFSGGIA